MTDDSFASFFSHPLGVALIAAVVAAITARLTVKAMLASGELVPLFVGPQSSIEDRAIVAAIAAAVTASFSGSRIVSISPIREAQRSAIIATIAAAVAASFANSRILHIGIVPSGSARKAQFPTSAGPSLL